MRIRDERKRRPVLDSLESRLAPSSLAPGSQPPQEVRHDGDGGHDDGLGRDRDRNRDRDGGGQDNGSWEPKPIGNSSTRPTIPTGPTGPVRWQNDGGRDHGDDGRDGDGDRGGQDNGSWEPKPMGGGSTGPG